jgi:prepilin-type N-terminal cleavage/methylation domain-containing protein
MPDRCAGWNHLGEDATGGARRGFTLIELMVTVLLLGIGLAGLVATSGAVSRMMGGSNRAAVAATVAASRFETLRGVGCLSITAGSATTRGITESWSATKMNAHNFDVLDSVSFVPISRTGTVKQAYRSYIKC